MQFLWHGSFPVIKIMTRGVMHTEVLLKFFLGGQNCRILRIQ